MVLHCTKHRKYSYCNCTWFSSISVAFDKTASIIIRKRNGINLRPWIYRLQETSLPSGQQEDLQMDYEWDHVEDYITLWFWIYNFGKLPHRSLRKYSILTDTEIKDIEDIKSGTKEELKVKIFPTQKYRIEHYDVYYQTHTKLIDNFKVVKSFFPKPIDYLGILIEYEYETKVGKKIGKYVAIFSLKPWYHHDGIKPLEITLEEEWGE